MNRSVEIISERPLGRILAEHVSGAILSVLPERWRRWWECWPSDAVLSGAIEAGVASYFFLRVFLHSMDAEISGIGMRGMSAIAMTHGDAGVMAIGPMVMFALLMKPATLALAITAFDGYVRAASALISHEAFASVWLAVPDKLVHWVNGWLNPPKKTAFRLFKD